MDFLRRHWEKLVLGVVLVSVLSGTVLLLRSVTATRVRVAEMEAEARAAASGGADIPADPAIENPIYRLLTDPQLVFATLATPETPPLRGSLYEPPDYIVCYSEACNKLVPIGSDKCPFCGTEQPPRSGDDRDSDRDRDGIPNHVEQKYSFLSPDNPRDASMDPDQDGFLNVEEYQRSTDMQSATSCPPLGVLLRVGKLVERPLPIMLRKIMRNTDDPAAWSLSMQVYDAAKKTSRPKLTAVGKSLEGFKVTKAAFEPDPQKEGKQIGVVEVVREVGDPEPYILKEGVPTNERDKFVQFGFLASRDAQLAARGGIRVYTQKAGDSLVLKHGKDPKDPSKQREETYKVESVAEGKVEVLRTEPAPAPGENPVRITVPLFNPRTDFAVQSSLSPLGLTPDGAAPPGMEMGPPGSMGPGTAPAMPAGTRRP